MQTYKIETPSLWIMAIFMPIGFLTFIITQGIITLYFLILFCFLILSLCTFGGYFYWKSYRRKNIIEKLIARGEHRNIIVIGVLEFHTGRRYSKAYYIYICKDPSNNKEYQSDKIDSILDADIEIGDIVHIYESTEYPDVYWIDLNVVKKGVGKGKLSQKELKTGKYLFQEAKASTKDTESINIIPGMITFGLMFVMIGFSLFPDAYFLFTGVNTKGIITNIKPYNTLCGGGRYSSNCTKYDLTISLREFETNYYKDMQRRYGDTHNNFKHPEYVGGGHTSARGKDQPISLSGYQVGKIVDVIVKPEALNNHILRFDDVSIKELLLKDIYRLLIWFGLIGIIFCILFLQWQKNKSIN